MLRGGFGAFFEVSGPPQRLRGAAMLRMRYVWALAAGCLLAPAPAYPASGQLVLSCKDGAISRTMHGASRTSDEALLVFDFDRAMLFHDRVARGTPIEAIKKFLIT